MASPAVANLRQKAILAVPLIGLVVGAILALAAGGTVPLVAATFAVVPYLLLKNKNLRIQHGVALLALFLISTAFCGGSPDSLVIGDTFIPPFFRHFDDTPVSQFLYDIVSLLYKIGSIPILILGGWSRDFDITCMSPGPWGGVRAEWFLFLWTLCLVSCFTSILTSRGRVFGGK